MMSAAGLGRVLNEACFSSDVVILAAGFFGTAASSNEPSLSALFDSVDMSVERLRFGEVRFASFAASSSEGLSHPGMNQVGDVQRPPLVALGAAIADAEVVVVVVDDKNDGLSFLASSSRLILRVPEWRDGAEEGQGGPGSEKEEKETADRSRLALRVPLREAASENPLTASPTSRENASAACATSCPPLPRLKLIVLLLLRPSENPRGVSEVRSLEGDFEGDEEAVKFPSGDDAPDRGDCVAKRRSSREKRRASALSSDSSRRLALYPPLPTLPSPPVGESPPSPPPRRTSFSNTSAAAIILRYSWVASACACPASVSCARSVFETSSARSLARSSSFSRTKDSLSTLPLRPALLQLLPLRKMLPLRRMLPLGLRLPPPPAELRLRPKGRGVAKAGFGRSLFPEVGASPPLSGAAPTAGTASSTASTTSPSSPTSPPTRLLRS
mmetsp:Transcript_57226/g.114831  ORF Transcript_57226/g.114831 Transcript_57226/m.114831 type:complete len:444 (-) Transcript_57226:784-2115(-)